MTAVRVFLDEDSSARRLIAAIRAAGIEVLSALELGRLQVPDAEQLDFAIGERCLMVTANKAHFAALHARLAADGRQHWGIVIRSAQATPSENVAQAIVELIADRDAESFQNALLFV